MADRRVTFVISGGTPEELQERWAAFVKIFADTYEMTIEEADERLTAALNEPIRHLRSISDEEAGP